MVPERKGKTMKTKLVITIMAVGFLVWCGAALGKWANAESQATQNRMASAMQVLR